MKPYSPKEYRVVSLRECPLPDQMYECSTPDKAVAYWRSNVSTSPAYNPDVENLYVIMVNTRRKILGHAHVSTGIMDSIIVHPREVFRPAIVMSAAAIIIGHNHPSGESQPSEADIKVTRDLIRAGQCLKIDVLDHVVVGNGQHTSLRELGYFYS